MVCVLAGAHSPTAGTQRSGMWRQMLYILIIITLEIASSLSGWLGYDAFYSGAKPLASYL